MRRGRAATVCVYGLMLARCSADKWVLPSQGKAGVHISPSSPCSLGGGGGGACKFFGPSQVDYGDANLSVVALNRSGSAHPFSSCCAACTAWNGRHHSVNCSVGVVLQGAMPLCNYFLDLTLNLTMSHTCLAAPYRPADAAWWALHRGHVCRPLVGAS